MTNEKRYYLARLKLSCNIQDFQTMNVLERLIQLIRNIVLLSNFFINVLLVDVNIMLYVLFLYVIYTATSVKHFNFHLIFEYMLILHILNILTLKCKVYIKLRNIFLFCFIVFPDLFLLQAAYSWLLQVAKGFCIRPPFIDLDNRPTMGPWPLGTSQGRLGSARC
jgi:hypothetical protein